MLPNILPSVPGLHGSETRKVLFLSMTSFPSLNGVGDQLKGPGSQHVSVYVWVFDRQRESTTERERARERERENSVIPKTSAPSPWE